MKLEITEEWLRSWDDDISDPAPYPTVEDFIEMARWKEDRRREQNQDGIAKVREIDQAKELVAAG